jgi:hypothetical protein
MTWLFVLSMGTPAIILVPVLYWPELSSMHRRREILPKLSLRAKIEDSRQQKRKEFFIHLPTADADTTHHPT